MAQLLHNRGSHPLTSCFLPAYRDISLMLSFSLLYAGHEEIVAGFNKAIAEMKKDGTHDRIVQKHKAYIEHPVKQ